MTDVHFRAIQRGELSNRQLISDLFASDIIPLSPPRIKSLQQCPFADDDDTVLVLALHNKHLIGFAGLIPVLTKNGKYFWNSGWWIKNGYNAYALPLLFQCIRYSSQKLIITDLNPHTLQIIQHLGKFQLREINSFHRIYFPLRLLQKIKGKWFISIPLASLTSKLQSLNESFQNLFNLRIQTHLDNTDRASINDFLKHHAAGEWTEKNFDYFQWVLKYPWLETTRDRALEQAYYPFSWIEKQFIKIPLLFKQENQIVLFSLLSLRRQNLRIDYLYGSDRYRESFARWLISLAKMWSAFSIITADKWLAKYILKHVKITYLRQTPRHFVYPHSISQQIPEIVSLQAGEGDVVFT